jgi:hypothetical protein
MVAAAMALAPRLGAERAAARLAAHQVFVDERARAGKKPPGHTSRRYGFPVVTAQEVDLVLSIPASVTRSGSGAWIAANTDAEAAAASEAAFELPFAPMPSIGED